MPLKATYDDLTEVPESFRELYAPQETQDGRKVFALSGIEGVMLADQHKGLIAALEKERESAATLKKQSKAYQDLGVTPDEIVELRQRAEETAKALEAASGDRKSAIDAAVQERVGALEREKDKTIRDLVDKLKGYEAKTEELSKTLTDRQFEDMLRSNVKDDIKSEAVQDVISRAKAFGWKVTPDGEMIAVKSSGDAKFSPQDPTRPILFSEWLSKVLYGEAPHLFKQSQGTGDPGGSGRANFSSLKRSKMTIAEKTKFIADNGPAEYRKLPD